MNMQPEKQLIEQRLKKLDFLVSKGVNPYPYSFDQKHHADEVLKKFGKIKTGQKTRVNVSMAGRIVLLRPMGKVSFGHIQDQTGRIQFYAKEDEIGSKNYEIFKRFDMGDIVGIKGTVFKTKSGEISIWVNEIILLAKAIRPLPEKYHGIKDPEIRYRYRHLGMVADKNVIDTFIKKAKVLAEIRKFLDEKGFIEVDIPILQPTYGGAAAKPFVTRVNALKENFYLQISPELYLKKMTIGGLEKVYFLGKAFRNEDIDVSHNPEFTMLEAYQAYVDLYFMMIFTEEMIERICLAVNGTTIVKYGANKINFKRPWKKMTMTEAIKKFANLDVKKLSDDQLRDEVKKRNLEIGPRGKMIASLFEGLVEDKLIQPIFITCHPVETTPLAKADRKKKGFVERFELFVNGMELVNAYSELNDPIEQAKRFGSQQKEKFEDGLEVYPMDKDFVKAMEYGMPPQGGMGIGVDRLVMFLTNSESIKEVIPFPLMKRIEDEGNSKNKS